MTQQQHRRRLWPGTRIALDLVIERPGQARLDVILAAGVQPQDLVATPQAHYLPTTGNGWWGRAVIADRRWVVRLSGNGKTSPWQALTAILARPDRPAVPMPALLLALYLALTDDPRSRSHELSSMLAGVGPIAAYLPEACARPGWRAIDDATVTRHAYGLLRSMLRRSDLVWPTSDGDSLRIFLRLSELLWTFDPIVVREISAFRAADFDQARAVTRMLTGIATLQVLRSGTPSIRGLPVQMTPGRQGLALAQGLVLCHPSAPTITDAALAWLCDGSLGEPGNHLDPDTQAARLAAARVPDDLFDHRMAAIAQLIHAGTCGTQNPSGRWELVPPAHLLPLQEMGVAALRIVASPDGFWVRLLPTDGAFGRVFWWTSEATIPDAWEPLLLGGCRSALALALHGCLAALWHDLRVKGRERVLFHAAGGTPARSAQRPLRGTAQTARPRAALPRGKTHHVRLRPSSVPRVAWGTERDRRAIARATRRRSPGKHEVGGHPRRTRVGRYIRPDAADLARQAGYDLQPGETWVTRFDRGTDTPTTPARRVSALPGLQALSLLWHATEEESRQ
ncbi:MAG TPA: hypothetical protein VFZ66_28015 [Herpetosiphonaceae bacterium]